MYGAIIGDIVGSKYEGRPIKTKDFPFISRGCTFTDDTVLTIAVARALLKAGLDDFDSQNTEYFKAVLVQEMQQLGRRFFNAGYGGSFIQWLLTPNPQPYFSFGNGSAMRVSPCGLIARSMNEALALAQASAEVTHDHPEGIRGAQAVAACVYLAKTGSTKKEIRQHVEACFYRPLPMVEEIRPAYAFDVTCQGSVPEAIACFLESTDYPDALRNAVSLGGDSDTQAAIAGSIAWSYYRLGAGAKHLQSAATQPAWCQKLVDDYQIDQMLPEDFVWTIHEFERTWMAR